VLVARFGSTWPHGARAKAPSSPIGRDILSFPFSSGFAGYTCYRRGKVAKLRQEHAVTVCGSHERGVIGLHWPACPFHLTTTTMDWCDSRGYFGMLGEGSTNPAQTENPYSTVQIWRPLSCTIRRPILAW